MDRRTFIGSVAGGGLAVPLGAFAQQQGKVWHIGVLYFASSSDPVAQRRITVFRQRLCELGYVEGQTIVIDERYAKGNAQRLTEHAREFAARKVDVIVAPAVAAATAARQATNTIPIVMVHAGNPVGAGLIASLARPGGNVTGTTNLPLGGKQVNWFRASPNSQFSPIRRMLAQPPSWHP